VARRELWGLLFRLAAEGITLVVTTHDLDEAERCGRVGYLYLSRLLTVGTPQELKALPAVTPAGTRRLEILGSNTTELLAWLQDQPAVREATIFGEAIHALVEDTFAVHELERQSILVRPTNAGLEDVFVTLSRRQAAAA
jgi:ABC-type multidrug transport system ATPase subunit